MLLHVKGLDLEAGRDEDIPMGMGLLLREIQHFETNLLLLVAARLEPRDSDGRPLVAGWADIDGLFKLTSGALRNRLDLPAGILNDLHTLVDERNGFVHYWHPNYRAMASDVGEGNALLWALDYLDQWQFAFSRSREQLVDVIGAVEDCADDVALLAAWGDPLNEEHPEPIFSEEDRRQIARGVGREE